jgi:hypothetical protein
MVSLSNHERIFCFGPLWFDMLTTNGEGEIAAMPSNAPDKTAGR